MPPRRTPPSPRLQQLHDLAADPAAQAALAQTILATEKDVQAIRAAVEVLKVNPTPAARSVLRERFEHYAADGIRRDTGGYVRAAILQALRPIALPADAALLERAAATYEFLPPGHSEEGSLLRSAALVTLDAVDSKLAAYHSIRLLADPHTSRLSGEPAVTAVHVLAAQGNLGPLYYYALHQANPQSDVLSECLKNLAELPPALSADKYAVYYYLVTRLVAAPTPAGLAELTQQAELENNPRKLGILGEALALGRTDLRLQASLATLRQRQKRPPARAEAQPDDERDND